MESPPSRKKGKLRKVSPKGSKTKKRKCDSSDGPACSMFLVDLKRRLSQRKKQEEESPINVVGTIIDNITSALPVKFSKKSPEKVESAEILNTLQTLAPELQPNTVNANYAALPKEPSQEEIELKIPRMPIIDIDELTARAEKRRKISIEDKAVNTVSDMATEISKHVTTLKKISLIAEEFNQKTAKSLKEIVDSVQEDLIKKLDEVQQSNAATVQMQALTELQAME